MELNLSSMPTEPERLGGCFRFSGNVFAYFQKHNSLYGAACVIIMGTEGQTGGEDAGVKEK